MVRDLWLEKTQKWILKIKDWMRPLNMSQQITTQKDGEVQSRKHFLQLRNKVQLQYHKETVQLFLNLYAEIYNCDTTMNFIYYFSLLLLEWQLFLFLIADVKCFWIHQSFTGVCVHNTYIWFYIYGYRCMYIHTWF